MNNGWKKVELRIDENPYVWEKTRGFRTAQVIEDYKAIGTVSKKEWEVYVYLGSKVNGKIKLSREDVLAIQKPHNIEKVSKRTKFDIWELKRLRDKGLSWNAIGAQLYSSGQTLRRYYRDYKHELNAAGDHIPG